MKDKIIVIQDELKDCGISSLLSIIRFYGGDISREYLREVTRTTSDGVSAYYLMETARNIGFDSYGMHMKIKDIKNDDLPVIAHLKLENGYQHFVVIYKINFHKQIVTVMDPSCGLKDISFIEWNKVSTDNYLIMKPNKIIPKMVKRETLFSFIKPFITKNIGTFIIIIILSIIYTLISIISSYSFKFFLNDISNLKIIFISLIMMIILKKLSNLFRNNLINYLNHSLDKSLYNEVYSHIINLPYLYYKNKTTGDILTRVNDLGNVKELISHLFVTLIIDIILLLFSLFFLFRINYKLSFILLIIVFIYIIYSLINNKYLNNYIRDLKEKTSIINTNLIEGLELVDTIKGLSLQNEVIHRFNTKYSLYSNISEKFNKFLNISNFIKKLILQIGNLIIIYIGVLEINKGLIDIGSLITYTSLMTYFLEPIESSLNLSYLYKDTCESYRRIKELLEIKKEDLLYEKKKHLSSIFKSIEFKNVSYSYNGVKNVINDVNLKIEESSKTLIYGPSGNGKSTLIKILMKYVDNYQGIVRINNYDLANICLYDIRDKITYVSQKERLFTDTLYNNIVLGKDIDYQEFLKICNITGVSEIVEKNNLNYEVMLEENGFNLSGGEKQRIILARTLLKKSDIYIFDEALNEIDIKKERVILKNIFDIYKDKTIIVISHRFNNSDLFDKKILVKDGCYVN